MPGFVHRLRERQTARQTVLCVGLDPDLDRLPASVRAGRKPTEAVVAFNRAVVEATAPYACAFKLNLAFYEALGSGAHAAIRQTLDAVPPGVLTIADGKRGDIGNSARFYAKALFDDLGFDACTVAPYMGRDAVAPFLARPGKAAFVLARTSNPSGADFQELRSDGRPLYLAVAEHVARWNEEFPGTAGLVAGATDPDALRQLRALCPSLPFLVPGLGAQGGRSADVAAAFAGAGSVLASSSRSILYASRGEDFAAAAGRAARNFLAGLREG